MRKRIKGGFAAALLAMVLLSVCGLGITGVSAEETTEPVAYLTDGKYPITNSDEPNGIKIQEYEQNHYAQSVSVSWGMQKTLTVYGSDDITKIVPAELFLTPGKTG